MENNKVTPCKACKKEVSKTAKTCPHCGQKNPGLDEKKVAIGCLTMIAIMILIMILSSIFDGEESATTQSKSNQNNFIPISKQNLDLSKARPYEVVAADDSSFSTRTRKQWFIITPAADFESLGQTAMQAAIDLQKQTSAQVATVYITIAPETVGKGVNLAIAHYAIDGGGFSGDQSWRWDVDAAERSTTDIEREISILWEENRGLFLVGGNLDEPALEEFIADEIGINVEEVELPWIITRDYYNN